MLRSTEGNGTSVGMELSDKGTKPKSTLSVAYLLAANSVYTSVETQANRSEEISALSNVPVGNEHLMT